MTVSERMLNNQRLKTSLWLTTTFVEGVGEIFRGDIEGEGGEIDLLHFLPFFCLFLVYFIDGIDRFERLTFGVCVWVVLACNKVVQESGVLPTLLMFIFGQVVHVVNGVIV
jgi:hypothetical protein